MTEFNESASTGYGNEPLEAPYENGRVLDESETSYDSQDAHFAAVDARVDQGVDNYYTAMQKEGYTPGEYRDGEVDAEIDALFTPSVHHETAEPGVSVRLDDRARAIAELMDGINVQNRLDGAKQSQALNKYKNPSAVLDGMERQAANHRAARGRAVEVLAKTAALRAIGFSENEALASQVYINRLVAKSADKGPDAVRARKKRKVITQRTSKKVLGN